MSYETATLEEIGAWGSGGTPTEQSRNLWRFSSLANYRGLERRESLLISAHNYRSWFTR